jgi:uncharacterized NAD(P)/FAD-binding protein YdhS
VRFLICRWISSAGWQQQPKSVLGDVVPSESTFMPRALYGAYLQHLLGQGVRDARTCKLEMVDDEVIRAEDCADGVILHLASGALLNVDIAVLATGNAPPLPVHPDIIVLEAAGFWRGNPWVPAVFAALDCDEPVLLVGTGLTIVDAVISLLDGGHTGPIHALSRHGLLPRRHAATQAAPPVLPAPLPGHLDPLIRTIRRMIASALEAGQDWRPVIDTLRPYSQDL